MTMIQQDQAAIELQRRDEWRKTLDREVQLNTAQIEAMQERVRNSVVTGGMAYDLQLFIARRGWEIGYATSRHTIQKWDSLTAWIEDYTDNGGLQSTPSKVFPYIAHAEVKVTDMQREAVAKFCTALDPVDRLAIRPQAMKVAEVLGDQSLVDIVHDTTKREHGGDRKSDQALVTNARSDTRLNPNTKQGARQQLRSYAADPKRCERYGKDHELCKEAWVKVEQGEMSVNEGRIHCGLQKKEPSRVFYATKDLEAFVARIKAVFPADACRTIAHLLTDSND